MPCPAKRASMRAQLSMPSAGVTRSRTTKDTRPDRWRARIGVEGWSAPPPDEQRHYVAEGGVERAECRDKGWVGAVSDSPRQAGVGHEEQM